MDDPTATADSDGPAARTDETSATEARVEYIRVLRAEISERVKLQHQITVIAGGSIAIAASLLGNDVKPSPWLLLGLSVLFLAFGFSMLEQDRVIVAAAQFILQRPDNPHATVQADWERHLRESTRNVEKPAAGIGAVLSSSAKYAIPVFGTIGASWAYLADADANQIFVLVPAVLMVAFLAEAVLVAGQYLQLGDTPESPQSDVES